MEEINFVKRVRESGGRVAIVGGWVRDFLRKEEPQDKDYVVAGLGEEDFQTIFPDAKKVGRSFPVFLLPVEGRSSEIALARTERKAGKGYLGFDVFADATVTLEEDLSRRDTTMNAMALELFSDGTPARLIDLFGGEEDICLGRICAVSERFMEDPVRALRAARQAAVFGYTVEQRTIAFMRECREELAAEPQERIFGELSKALSAPHPSVFFQTLLSAELLETVFPEIFALIGKTQPTAFHPEGDAFAHTMATVDAVAHKTDHIAIRFAALVHDIGKGLTPADMLPHHYGHEERGLLALAAWNQRMTLPKLWIRVSEFVIAEHMRASRLKKPGKIADLLMDISRLPISAEDLFHIFSVDHGNLSPYFLRYDELISGLLAVKGSDVPEGLRGEAIGAWIRARRARIVQRILEETI